MRVLCGIVTYHPSERQITACVSSIAHQNVDILIVDNTPNSSKTIIKLTENDNGGVGQISVIYNNENRGIASALGQIMDYAIENGYSHVLTLDQDSSAEEHLIEHYISYWFEAPSDAGALTSGYLDRNTGTSGITESVDTVSTCITSGFFISVDAYRNTPGYDEWMFIDCVDLDICYSIQEAGYKIYRIPVIGIQHEIGMGKNVSPFSKHLVVSNHVPWRRYYMARNGIYLAAKHPKYGTVLHAIKKQFLIAGVVFVYEDRKAEKLYFGLKGICAGIMAVMSVRRGLMTGSGERNKC